MGKIINMENSMSKDTPKTDSVASAFIDSLGIGGLKTFKAPGSGTVYATIAEKGNLTMSVAAKLQAHPLSPLIGVFLRLRAECNDNYTIDNMGGQFGFPEMETKSNKHASCELFVPLALMPVTPAKVGNIVVENAIISTLIMTIENRLSTVDLNFSVPVTAITEYLANVFEDMLPSGEEKNLKEFPVLIGTEEIKKGILKIKEDYYP